jgi:hypothetical protein
MEQQIWKFPLRITDAQVIKLPKSSRILCVQEQNGYPCIWALVYPHMEMEGKTIEIVGTGHPIPQGGDTQRSYLGTVQINGLVWHIFESYQSSAMLTTSNLISNSTTHE